MSISILGSDEREFFLQLLEDEIAAVEGEPGLFVADPDVTSVAALAGRLFDQMVETPRHGD